MHSERFCAYSFNVSQRLIYMVFMGVVYGGGLWGVKSGFDWIDTPEADCIGMGIHCLHFAV